jgi:hypothetical protein
VSRFAIVYGKVLPQPQRVGQHTDLHKGLMLEPQRGGMLNTLGMFDPHGFPKMIGDLAKSWEKSLSRG